MTSPPPVINPTAYGVRTFNETFQKLDVGEDASHRWRDIVKGGTDASAHSLGTTTWYGGAGDGPPPFKVGGGGLVITATKQPQPFGRSWRSAIVTTKFTFSQLHGYFEFAATLPACVRGAWPGLWLMPVTNGWPANGEIDAPETIGDGKFYWSTHSGVKAGSVTLSTPGDCDKPHLYGVLWQADTIAFYLDRKLVQQTPTPADYVVPMYFLIDLNVGGGWPGAPDPGLRSVQMSVSRVSAWVAPQ